MTEAKIKDDEKVQSEDEVKQTRENIKLILQFLEEWGRELRLLSPESSINAKVDMQRILDLLREQKSE